MIRSATKQRRLSWYVNVLAVHAEYRGTGVGGALLNYASRRLHDGKGYEVAVRRPRVAFETDRTGSAEWLLMMKDLKV